MVLGSTALGLLASLDRYTLLLIVTACIALLVHQVVHWRRWWRSVKDAKRKTRGVRIKKSRPMTVETFFKLRQRSMKRFHGRTSRPVSTFAGVYILHNRTTNRYYVGQGKDVLNRANKHFTGRGNGDVYVDYKNGHDWYITLVKLDETSFRTLNDLERHLIGHYDAYHNGYNKTRGNR